PCEWPACQEMGTHCRTSSRSSRLHRLCVRRGENAEHQLGCPRRIAAQSRFEDRASGSTKAEGADTIRKDGWMSIKFEIKKFNSNSQSTGRVGTFNIEIPGAVVIKGMELVRPMHAADVLW